MLNNKIFALLLGLVAMDSGALTMGRVRGAALLGQPLNLTVSVELAPGESASTLCPEADVFHADNRVLASQVRTTTEAGQGQTAVVRVYSAALVDEPVVTVYVKAGCEQKITRRFVMLADVPTESAPAILPTVQAVPVQPVVSPAAVEPPAQQAVGTAPPAVGATSTAPVPAQSVRTPPAPRKAPAKKPVARQQPVAAPAPQPPAVKPAAPPAVELPKEPAKDASRSKAPDAKKSDAKASEPKAAAKDTGQAKLKLDPLLGLQERVAALETASVAPTPEQVKEAERVKSLEDSVKALVALAAKNEATLLEMRSRLQRSEEDRVSMRWIYALGAALLAALGAIAYLFLRGRQQVNSRSRQDDWWGGGRAEAQATAPSASDRQRESHGSQSAGHGADAAHGEARFAASQSGTGQFKGSVIEELHEARTSRFTAEHEARAKAALDKQISDESNDVDVSLVEMSESNFDNLMQSGEAHSALRRGPLPQQQDAMATRVQPMELKRSLDADLILDVQQQAQFFQSLGQTDQAIRVLEENIQKHGLSSPALYVDLLGILQRQGLKSDFDQMREEFNLMFNGHVPGFEDFHKQGLGLEDYPHVLSHVSSLWNTPKVLKVLEASVLRDPADTQAKAFDLAAFKDLLFLHAIAQTTAKTGPVSGLMPLAADEKATHKPSEPKLDIAFDTKMGVLAPMGAQDADLDLDLSEVAVPSLESGAQVAGVDVPISIQPDDNPPLPVISPDFGASASPEAGKKGLVDNNFLNFETDQTVKYSLPKKG